MKNINPLDLFDDHFLMEKLTKLGDPQKLNDYIDWAIFKTPIDGAFIGEQKDKSKGGRPAFDKLMLFKALLIQSLYNLSDDQLEYQIIDRASFKRPYHWNCKGKSKNWDNEFDLQYLSLRTIENNCFHGIGMPNSEKTRNLMHLY